MNYTFDFNAVSLAPLLQGLWVSLELTAAANVIGIVFGFALALLIMSPYRIVRLPFMLFVEFFRCTPAIVQIVWIFYCVPMLFDVFLDPVTMGIMALGLNLMAFNAEAYRASIQAVPREQLDAGIALGLNPLQRVLHIVFPTAFRASIPVLLTNGIVIFQQSALVAIVAIQDLMYQGKTLATETYRPIETFTVVALIYFAVSFPITQIVGLLERRRQILVS
ncbi:MULTISPECIES: amino acid ABC transporter permease [Rhizobium]|jgi:polar amino acid transport system permease protein|uniref:Amino acid ABC transporter permease n=1 Tax=Rhizobium anhuiense TaxID=1184720 RepID=A0A3S0RQJ3_9HYPH|nr:MULTISPECIES: amino acid ABC transporter permease [Rhizobium]KZS55056.1 amino acid ABC transporter permease [Rhizobium anhuiense bv. trifolii]MBB3301641.1 polar amino acid transport system permease protein [Rhizobium sp. BK112]MBB3370889.1 polar amino acid transport system permease protein [Rhizobium sp. BK077]MBB3746850.1 polar amino acid transport system permease protein [Rhizobium sp. BK591]MBB4115423.1 polar amino acid transport system permease protein [Rhizobium sp. BK226]